MSFFNKYVFIQIFKDANSAYNFFFLRNTCIFAWFFYASMLIINLFFERRGNFF